MRARIGPTGSSGRGDIPYCSKKRMRAVSTQAMYRTLLTCPSASISPQATSSVTSVVHLAIGSSSVLPYARHPGDPAPEGLLPLSRPGCNPGAKKNHEARPWDARGAAAGVQPHWQAAHSRSQETLRARLRHDRIELALRGGR